MPLPQPETPRGTTVEDLDAHLKAQQATESELAQNARDRWFYPRLLAPLGVLAVLGVGWLLWDRRSS